MKRIAEWQVATVKSIWLETPSVKTFTLAVPNWIQHKAGQHYDVRLTAPEGYEAACSYSIASEPERTGEIDLTVVCQWHSAGFAMKDGLCLQA